MALKWLRDQFKHLKIVLWGVILVFVALVFVDWGSGRASSGGGDDFAIRIGDRAVSEQEFVSSLRQNQQRYRQIYGDQWDQFKDQINLASQTVQMMVERQLLLDEADQVGLAVSPKELQEEILSYPAFQRQEGGFVGQETYLRILRANQTTAHEFEQRLAQDLKLQKLNAMLQDGVFVSDDEVKESYRRERESADFEAIQLRYERFLTDVEVNDEEIKAYFDANAEDYRRPEQRTIRYLVVATSTLRRILEADDESLQEFYNKNRQDFKESEQVKASHILIRLNPDASEVDKTEAKMHAEQVAQMAKSGAPFAELAAQHSDDPRTKDNGGDLGWINPGQMVELEDAIFGANPGDIVGPVKSQYGYHIIKVEDHRPERVLPFEEVRTEVNFRYLEGRSAAESEARAIALAQRVKSEEPETDKEWQKIADEDEAVALNVSPAFGAEETIQGIENDTDLVDEVFSSEVGDISGPRSTRRGWIVWQLAEIEPAGIPAFEAVSDEVEQEIRREKALELAAERGRELAETWRAEDLETQELADRYNGTLVPATNHRRGTAIGTLGVLPKVDQEIFDAEEGAIVGPVDIGDLGALVASIDRLSLIDPAKFEEEKAMIRDRLMRDRANRLRASIVNERRRDTIVTVNNQLMERFAPQSS